MLSRRWLGLVAIGSVVGLVASPDVTANAGPGTTVSEEFTFTGAAETFTVPAGVCEVVVTALGAQGGRGNDASGGAGGRGGQAIAIVTVDPLEDLAVTVGGQGGDATSNVGGAAGFNGGGPGGNASGQLGGGGGGGGLSAVRRATEALVVAGGGAGGGGSQTGFGTGGAGGDGGGAGTNGGDGFSGAGGGQSGGNGGAGGAGDLGGTAGGNGADALGATGGTGEDGGGGGGGGYPLGGGGGGGTNDQTTSGGGGGGGGSGFTEDGTGMTDGVREGNGSVTIAYDTSTDCVAQASLVLRCPPDDTVEITVDNTRQRPLEVSQDGVVLGVVDPRSSNTFTTTNSSAAITATVAGDPVQVDVSVATPGCEDDDDDVDDDDVVPPVLGRPTLAG